MAQTQKIVEIEGVKRLVVNGRIIQNKDIVQGRIDALDNQIGQCDSILAKTGETILTETTAAVDQRIAQQQALRASLNADSLKVLSDQRFGQRKDGLETAEAELETLVVQLDDEPLVKEK